MHGTTVKIKRLSMHYKHTIFKKDFVLSYCLQIVYLM